MTQQTLSDEAQRLLALRKLRILDTEEEAAFDRITRLASFLFNVPIALVSLVDDERQWFKSRVGLEACETSREASFCSHALGAPGPFVIEDATKDARFADNPLVTGPPHIRFYAGAQLRTQDGFDIGTLCVIAPTPRPAPSPREISLLQDLAATTTLLIEQRRIRLEHQAEVEARRVAEEEMLIAKEEAEAATEAMRTLFSRVSHDLRTPLAAITGFAELLADGPLTDDQRSDLEEIQRGGRNMLVMIDTLLHVAHDRKQPFPE